MMLKKFSSFAICLLWLSMPPMTCLASDDSLTEANTPSTLSSPGPGTKTTPEETQGKKPARNVGIAPIPIIFFTPETSLAIGGGVVFTFRDPNHPNDKRPDNLQLIAAYTLKNQIFFSLTPEIYFNDKQGKLNIHTSYARWPTSFFGVGNDADMDADDIDELEEVYTSNAFTVQPWIVHKAFSQLSLGMTVDIGQTDISDIEDDGILDQGKLTGSDGGTRSGLGPVLSWDTRDSIFYPTRGSWHKIWSWHYRDAIGSDFDYDVYAVDLRVYHPITNDHILAFHALGVSNNGEVPFDELPSPMIRGLYEDLFIDKNMFTLQMEYRFPIHERWSGVTFAAAGDVFHDNDDIDTQNMKYAGGGGVRYAIDKKEKINLRIDIGVSPYGIFPYVLFQEAF